MPLVKVSVGQLEAAQELYVAATRFITDIQEKGGRGFNFARLDDLVYAVDHCKEEYEKHG